MYQSTYYVPKESDTQADALVAYGLAELLQALIPGRYQPDRAGPALEDKGAYYQITLPSGLAIEEAWLDNLPNQLELAPFVKTAKEKPPPDFPSVRDSDAEWDNFKAYTKALSEMRSADTANKAVDSDAARAVDSLRPRPDFWTIAYVSDFRMQGIGVHNKLVEQWWRARPVRKEQVQTILQLFATPSDNGQHKAAVFKAWDTRVKKAKLKLTKEFTASQMLNPHTGKGQNRPKADAVLSPKNESSFWLVEYLKVVGLYACAAPRAVQGGGMRKTYVLSPKRLALKRHREIFRRFNQNFWNETAIKMDIIAALLYTKTMLEYTEVEEVDVGLSLLDLTPTDYVQGFHVTTYRQLSANAYTMMNQSFIGLPQWAAISIAMERKALQAVLDEHIARIGNRALDESRNEGYHLLLLYRDFLSGNQWDKLFDFLIGYGQHLLSQIHRKNYFIQPFSEKNIRRLLMTQTNYSRILQNEGFQRVAEAIRRSTIIPIYRQDSLYETRFGLSQTLKRASRYEKDEFIEALTEFMHSYNEENALKYNRHGKSFRSNLTRKDVEDVIGLIDEYDSPQLICNLLLAYGFARDPKETQTITETEER
jgi:hypothetical protein